jgi:hypothetical protein
MLSSKLFLFASREPEDHLYERFWSGSTSDTSIYCLDIGSDCCSNGDGTYGILLDCEGNRCLGIGSICSLSKYAIYDMIDSVPPEYLSIYVKY